MIKFLTLLLVTLWLPLSHAQEPAPPLPAPAAPSEESLESLEALLRSIQSREEEIASVQAAVEQAPTEVERDELLAQLKGLHEELDKQNQQFVKFAVEIDTRPFIEEEETAFDWQQELGKLLRPIIAEFENATAESRAVGELRAQLRDVAERRELADEAVANLEQLEAAAGDPALKARLGGELETWTRTRNAARDEERALRLRLNERLEAKKSLVDSTTGYARDFFQSRGLNLLWGILAFAGVFLFVRLLGVVFGKVRPAGKKKDFGSRLGMLLVQVGSILGGLLATLAVFNMVGDWFLLGIVVIFLLGVGWAGINTLPQHVETVKLILNIGAVKEGERLVFDGTPWCVESLGFSANLVNPLLDGGGQRLPVKYLVGMHSRPMGEHEEWFPSRPGDWVELADGTTGRVAYQNPAMVQVVELGGAQKIYPTPDYLSLHPKNLSTNFRVETTFGVDYKHQAIATTEIPATMEAKLKQELPQVVEAGHIQHVGVRFACAGASSLDYEVEVDLKGEAASKAEKVRHGLQRILVDACNENGWEIPFMQVTVHQPAGAPMDAS